jgi:2-polyprenyl-3-methyl-5-hydroxy-6-metoxy-1,4-benzoquinol methylase
LEEIKYCALCGSSDTRLLYAGHDRLHNEEGEFYLFECQKCELIYLNPRPSREEIDRYYPQDYISYPHAIEDEPNWIKRLDRQYGLHKRVSQVIRRVGTSGRILDIGCATGIFLNGMHQKGWEAYGVEPSHYAAEYARQHFNLAITNGYLEDGKFTDSFFNAVSMWDVLEHVPDPLDTLSEISRILAPGGWLVLSLPNPESWERSWFGQYWAGWDVPRHFHLFNRHVLSNILQHAGFRIKEIVSFTGRHGVLVLNLQFWLGSTSLSTGTQHRLLKFARSLPARILTYPFYAIADSLNKSSTMVVFAEKVND